MIATGKLRSGKEAGGGAASPHTPLNLQYEKEIWLHDRLKAISKKPEIWKEAHLRHDLGIDSLTFMEIISAIETHWAIQVADEDFNHIFTVSDILERLNQGTPGKVPAEMAAKKEFDFTKNNSWSMNFLRYFFHAFVIRPFLKLFFKFKVVNQKELASNDNFVVTPNHSSHLDLLTILSCVPLRRVNRTYAVAADDYFFDRPLKSFIVRLFFNAIPFERKARVERSFRICEDILRGGGSLVIFPEGTRSVSGQMSPFKPGVGRLLASHGYAAIPAYINGAYEAFPKGASLPRPLPVSVYVGTPSKFLGVPANSEGYQGIAEK